MLPWMGMWTIMGGGEVTAEGDTEYNFRFLYRQCRVFSGYVKGHYRKLVITVRD